MNGNDDTKDDARRPPAALLKTLFRLIAFARPYRFKLGLGVFLTMLAMVVWLTIPLGLKSLLDAVFAENDAEFLDVMAIGMFLLFVVQSIFSFSSHYLVQWVGERVVADMRVALYGHLNRLGLRFFADRRLGELTSRLTNDVGAVQTAVTGVLVDSIRQIFFMFGSVAVMVTLNWRLSLVIFLAVPIAALISRQLGQIIRSLSGKVQDRLADTTAVAEEALGAVRVVKAFAREPYEIDRYNTGVEELFLTARKRFLTVAAFSSAVGFLFMGALVVIFWYGGREVLEGRLSTGDLVAFIFYAFNISRSVMGMSSLYSTMNSAAGASERLFELLETEPEIADVADAIELVNVAGAVQLEEVSFSYDEGTSVLHDISLFVAPGETVALVGPSGAGKTTLLNLIPRFFDPTAGRILVDGHDLRSIAIRSLRERIGLVAQDVHLFGTSVRENIRYGRLEATDAEIEEAAIAANAHDFIQGFADGYDSMVGEKGVKLSGGQRQRIAIARALLRDPQILLLDEATSSLDSESEALIQQAMLRLLEGRTTFIIAHRLSTVMHASRIFVLDGGRIVESGPHEELYAQGGLYRRLCDLQFREGGEADERDEEKGR